MTELEELQLNEARGRYALFRNSLMFRLVPVFIALLSLAILLVSYFATLDISTNLSPQGCRMSWMSPSYVLQSDFDTSWSPLARRYSLWLYREVGWESSQIREKEGGSLPVLFIPGNAGSSHQVRSIASSATRQYYSSPYVVASDFASSSLKPLDFFTVEFNEDLSAFHGPTLDSQIAYTSRAISYILSLYPHNTQIIIMGHSMGGIVATSLLPISNGSISAVITMSTPHTLPPVRFDSRIEALYDANRGVMGSDTTPILSLCGGATDMMIPSESCILPASVERDVVGGVYRRTVFTSALEGAWTGVGHQEMVWCHQVRWRVARAALELGDSTSIEDKARVLDKWLRDGHTPPQVPFETPNFLLTDPTTYETLPPDMHLVLKSPRGSRTYLLPVPAPSTTHLPVKFILLVSQGSIPPVSPQSPFPLTISVNLCVRSSSLATPFDCELVQPTVHKLIPNPVSDKVFPVPDEGSDESEGVVLFEAEIPLGDDTGGLPRWIAVRMDDADGRGWVVGGISTEAVITNTVSTFGQLFGSTSITIPSLSALKIGISLPNLLSSALVVYRLTPKFTLEKASAQTCSDPLMPPLITHTSHLAETHYFPLHSLPHHRILLHTHSSAPFTPTSIGAHRGLSFDIYSSGSTGCKDLAEFEVRIDFYATLGRWASRYYTTLASWAVGAVALLVFGAWTECDKTDHMPTIEQSLSIFGRQKLPKLLIGSFLLSFVPLSEGLYLGNRGEPLLSLIAPLILLVATGLVFISWWALVILMWPLGRVSRILFGRRKQELSVRRSTMVSMVLIFLLVFLFIPWQVAFLGCWLIHLYTCASTSVDLFPQSTPTPPITAIPLLRQRHNDDESENEQPSRDIPEGLEKSVTNRYKINNHHHNLHLLLLMTWLLPLVAPVLAVWVRTLITAGFTAPFDGDHFFPNVAPFLVIVDFASWTTGPLFERQKFEDKLSVRWLILVVAGVAFLVGSRRTYMVFDAAKIALGLIFVVRVGPRYWGGSSSSYTTRVIQ